MIELQTVTTKAKNPSTNEFQDVTWGGINVLSTSGTTNYNNLTNKPTINGVTVQGSLTTGDLLITAADVGALPSGTKYGADFALSIDSQTFVVTAQLKDQDGNNLGQAKTIDLPLETMVVSGSYDDTTQKIILTLKNGQTVEFSVADLVSGLQSEITLSNKLDADLVSDVSSENKFVTTAEKAAWNAKANASEVYTKKQTDSAIETAIGALDVSSVGGSGKYISEISETDGKISPIVETMDTVPTNGSTKAVTSGAVHAALGSKQDALSQSQLAAANSGITAEKLTADEAAIAEVVDNGAKNLFDYDVLGSNSSSVGTSVVVNGVRFTMNSDKSVTVNRESSSSQDAYVWFRKSDGSARYVTDFCDDEHVFSGAAGASASTYRLYINNINGSNTYKYFGEGEIIGTPQVTPNAAGIFIAASYNPSNLVIKPMICSKSQWDVSHQFEPYALPNPIITPALIEQVDNGAKNIVHTQDITRQGKGYIATPNGDGTYTITGSRTDAGSAWFEVADVSADAGSYILSGGVTGIPVAISVSGSVVYAESSAQEINAEISNKLYIHIPAEFNQSNINYVIKPMICTKAVWYISQKYVPYAPTNRELYAMIQALQNGTRSAPALAKADPEETEPETGEEEMR